MTACQIPPAAPGASAQPARWTDVWESFDLPGKRATRYVPVQHDRRWVLHASSQRSASVYRRPMHVPSDELGQLSFSWKVAALVGEGDVRRAETEDAPVRVVLAFDGDRARLSARNRMMFDLMQALSGEPPPFATLMYVWDSQAPVGTVVVNERTDRVRQIVIESGTAHVGTWRSYSRDVVADFQRAYGEKPGALLGVAVMTDSDNTRSQAEAWYGEISLTRPAGSAAP
ncbi:MAG: DUF3047 domain-containing protein [Rubrivivax sp.]